MADRAIPFLGRGTGGVYEPPPSPTTDPTAPVLPGVGTTSIHAIGTPGEGVNFPMGTAVKFRAIATAGAYLPDKVLQVPLSRMQEVLMAVTSRRSSSASKLKKGSRKVNAALAEGVGGNLPSVDPLVNNDRGRTTAERSAPQVVRPARESSGPVTALGGRSVEQQLAHAAGADKTAAGVRSPVAGMAAEAVVSHLPAFIRRLVR